MSDFKKSPKQPAPEMLIPKDFLPNAAEFITAECIVQSLPAGAILIVGRSTVVVVPDWVTSNMLMLAGITVPGCAAQRFVPQLVVHMGIRIVSATSIFADLQREGYGMFDLNSVKATLDQLNALGGKGKVMRLRLKCKL